MVFFSLPALAGNLAHSHILKMPEKERLEALGGVLNASGKPCDATKTFYQGMDSDGSAYWDVACKNGKSFVVQVPRDVNAKTRIMGCDFMKMLGTDCWIKL
jgi:hypothetical protein